jgi:hypothetical protein
VGDVTVFVMVVFGVFKDTFPEGAKDAIKNVLKWIEDYFSKNQPSDTIPYESYITQQLHVYPYRQN